MKAAAPCVLVVTLVCAPLAAAQEAAAPAAPAAGFRAEFLRHLDDMEKKMVSLAEAVPQEKYGWRPGEGVRSVGEAYMHMVLGNYFLPRFAGIQPPAEVTREMEKTVTEKAQVVDWLKKSFAHVRQAISNTPDADLDKPTKLFGRDATVREVFFLVANHQHEHLGQSIAYARSNGVVPPWTAERQARQAQQPQQPRPQN
jgi:uncharacterized damage-inducible protein DinB